MPLSDTKRVSERYEILDVIGRGGMGTVYRVRDRIRDQEVALKLLQITPTLTPDDVDSKSQRRLITYEFRVNSSLRHPYVVSVLDYGFTRFKQPFFTMELVRTPRTIVDAAKALAPAERLRYLVELLQALTYLHRRGVIHSDLKPANILVDHEDHVKVLDFGLAVLLQRSISNPNEMVGGTIPYMAPELFYGSKQSAQSDLYAVGVIAFEIFAGRLPFDGQSVSGLITQIISNTPNWDPLEGQEPIKKILMRLLDKDPDERYDDALAVLEDLRAIGGANMDVIGRVDMQDSHLEAASFVGRRTELDMMERLLEQARNKQGGLVIIGGESGVGKTRLMEEMRVKALVDGVLVVQVSFTEDTGLPLSPWREAVSNLLLQVPLERTRLAMLKFLIPNIEQLIGEALPPPPEGNAFEQQIDAIVQLFSTINTPLLLMIDDLHWAAESLQLVSEITQAVSRGPVLLVATYRSDERPTLPDMFPDANHIPLSRLMLGDTQALCVSMLGEKRAKDSLVNYLYQQTEGNALFLVETLRELSIKAGDLNQVHEMSLPHNLLAGGVLKIIQRRLSKLMTSMSVQDADILQLAAVLGREIDPAVLEAVYNADAVESLLYHALNSAVVEVDRMMWRFSHDKLRDAVLLDIDDDTRRNLHQMAAEAIEATYPGNNAYFAALVAHWHAAGVPHKEAHYACLLAVTSLERSLYDQAIQFAGRALDLIDPDEEPGDAVVLYTVLGTVYQQRGNVAQSSDFYARAAEAAEQANDHTGRARALQGLGQLSALRSDFSGAVRYFNASRQIFQQAGDVAGTVTVLGDIGAVAVQTGDIQAAMNDYALALGIALKANMLPLVGQTLRPYARLTAIGGDYDTATSYLDQCENIYTNLEDVNGLAWTLLQRAELESIRGGYWQVPALLKAAEDGFRELTNTRGIASVCISTAAFHIVALAPDEAERYLNEALTICTQVGDRANLASALCSLGYVAYLRGDYGQAKEYVEEGVAILEGVNGYYQQLPARWYQVEILLSLPGQLSQAVAAATEYLEAAQAMGDPNHIAHALVHQAILACERDDYEVAWSLLRDMLSMTDAIGAVAAYHRGLAALAVLLIETDRLDGAAAVLAVLLQTPERAPNALIRRRANEIADEVRAAGGDTILHIEDANVLLQDILSYG